MDVARTGTLLPTDLLAPGTRDAHRVMALWLVRRSAFAAAVLGLTVGILVTPGHDVTADLKGWSDVWDVLLSPAAGVALLLLIRAGTSFVGLAFAAPVARAFDLAGSATGCYSGNRLDRFVDAFGTTRGLRTLRFTRHVRDAAIARVEPERARYERIERQITIANRVLPVCFVLLAVLLG